MDELILLNYYNKRITQRRLSELSGISLGKINKLVNSLKNQNILKDDNENYEILEPYKVKNAIILSAGFGLRMFPANSEKPKSLMVVKEEVLIERIIKQLHDRDINDIYVVVGFQKEKFEYLIDKYNIHLIVNSSYQNDNNLISLQKASTYIGRSYIVPGDLYLKENIFNKYENDSWYSLSSKKKPTGYYYVSRNNKLIKGKNLFYDSIGIAYISDKDKVKLIDNINLLVKSNIISYWEDALFLAKREIDICVVHFEDESYFEINTYNDLQKIDEKSDSLNISCIRLIQSLFNIEQNNIKNVMVSKKGMTNKSITFEVNNEKYIMRVPGEGTEKLINRSQEYKVYEIISKYGISDDVIYINPENGIKITKYIYNAHNCNPYNFNEVASCFSFLKKFHNLNIKVGFEFDLFKQIDYYESLMSESLYIDYKDTKKRVIMLKSFIDMHKQEYCLCHIDSVADNFLVGEKQIKMIDWEYSANQDPHVDIAMFIIYAGYDKNDVDKVIDIYFENECDEIIRIKIYALIAVCGLLWSNWCEYKRTLGIEFGDYSLSQYRYAKVYSRLVLNYLENKNE